MVGILKYEYPQASKKHKLRTKPYQKDILACMIYHDRLIIVNYMATEEFEKGSC